ncbi:hypothetical protein Sviol_55190 [Streptomyces violascens]|uniref:Uncharacterized protein n=1 Tax=Streptomyces violascens TaxID=67381 RepID=A0ABQ3QUZ9_9ACTN|nr:hypothetical protein Sviol_55190 [Streptomyces violascens]
MTASVHSPGALAATVHVLDPVGRVPLVLAAGTEITDPAIADQITNPRCWQDSKLPAPKGVRKAKPAGT